MEAYLGDDAKKRKEQVRGLQVFNEDVLLNIGVVWLQDKSKLD